MQQIILHHYNFSNYAEKVRLALGYKSLSWHSVEIPSVAPKPDLQVLTGGYRRTPVLQVGADIYCDTRLILKTLERLKPAPTLYPALYSASASAIAYWAENQLFRPISLYVSGSNSDVFSMDLQADRARMRGMPAPTEQAIQRAAARNAPLVRVQLPMIEEMLDDGRFWLLGPQTTVADFAVYHALWFITGRSQRLASELQPFTAVRSWMSRMAAFGHGERHAMSAATALEIGAHSRPNTARDSQPFAEDPQVGTQVRIRAADYGRDVVTGALAFIDEDEIAIERCDDRLGEIVVHFPRLGYDLR